MAIIKPIHLLCHPPQRGEGSPTFGIVSLVGGLGLVDFNTSCHQTNLPAAQRVLKPSFTDSNLPRGAIRETRTRTGGSVLFFPPSCETLRTKEPHLVPKPHPGMSGLCQAWDQRGWMLQPPLQQKIPSKLTGVLCTSLDLMIFPLLVVLSQLLWDGPLG